MKQFLTIWIFFITMASAMAQSKSAVPQLRFPEDSVKIGMPTPVSLVFTHPWKQDVFFPDSTFNFAPFEFHHKKAFPTITKDSMSTDSVVYWLTTFEVDKVQKLALPVFIPTKNDSVPVQSNTDSIVLHEVIPVVKEEMEIMRNTSQLPLPHVHNYPLYIILAIAALINIIVFSVVFRSNIVSFFLLYRKRKQHEQFVKQFDSTYERFMRDGSTRDLEELLRNWKNYMEKLVKAPISKMSTREIGQRVSDESLVSTLKAVDGQIFGGITMPDQDLTPLKKVAHTLYEKTIRKLKNGG